MLIAIKFTARTLLFCGVLFAASSASAHKPSDSYLAIQLSNGLCRVQWDIGLRDLEHALDLDEDDDGAIRWGELKGRFQALDNYVLGRLQLLFDAKPCQLEIVDHLIQTHSDGAYAVVLCEALFPRNATSLEVRYGALFDVDPQHRGLLRLEQKGHTQTAIFAPNNSAQTFDLKGATPWSYQFLAFLKQGVWHIWAGIDHIFFLIALLLPAVLGWSKSKWEGLPSMRLAFIEVAKIVTAFTIAHSITLAAAALHWVNPPSRIVEATIAASVALAALNNLKPLVRRGAWILAFGFGLIHGFGFANVLNDLGLDPSNLALSLFGFNIGVELGQLAIVAAFLPVAFVLRNSWFYQSVTLKLGSACVALIATIWMVERIFELKLLPL